MRRKPQQARSIQRVNLILDVAAAVFAEVGYEAATTNLIAERAGVPVGSLYQFFSNKEAILEGLVERYVAEMRQLNTDLLTPEMALALPMPELISQLVDGIAAFESSHAAFKTLFLQTGIDVATHEIHHEIVQRVVTMMTARYPHLPDDKRHLMAVVSVSLVKTMMPLMQPPDSLPPQQALTETKAAVVAYVESFLQRHNT